MKGQQLGVIAIYSVFTTVICVGGAFYHAFFQVVIPNEGFDWSLFIPFIHFFFRLHCQANCFKSHEYKSISSCSVRT